MPPAWSAIALLVGTSVLVSAVSRSGLLGWIALRVARRTGGDPIRLLRAFGVLTVVFAATVGSTAAMVIVGALSVVTLERLGRRDALVGFLLIEALLANVGALLTLIGSVPNMVAGVTAGLPLAAFFVTTAPFVAVATAATLLLGARLFEIRPLATEAERAEARRLVAAFDERAGIERRGLFVFSAVLSAGFLLTLAALPLLPRVRDVGPGVVALAFAAVMLARAGGRLGPLRQAADWPGLALVAGVVLGVEWLAPAARLAAAGFDGAPDAGLVFLAATLLSGLAHNLPVAAGLADVVAAGGAPAGAAQWWGLVFGANLGGNLSPIGSAATLTALAILRRHGLSVGSAALIRGALPCAVLPIALAAAYVWLFLT